MDLRTLLFSFWQGNANPNIDTRLLRLKVDPQTAVVDILSSSFISLRTEGGENVAESRKVR